MGTRRQALKGLFAFAGSLQLPSNSQPVDDGRRMHRQLGIRALRFLNTAEHWNKSSGVNRFVPFAELAGSAAVAAMRTDERTVMKGIGAEFIDAVDFGREEIVPGWRLHVVLIDDESSYRAILEDVSNFGVGDLSTDATGLILDGRSAIQAHVPQRRGFAVRAVSYFASLGASQGCGYSPGQCDAFSQFSCWWSGHCCACLDDICCVNCFTKCCNNYLDGACVNCGCGSCIWVCEVTWGGCCV